MPEFDFETELEQIDLVEIESVKRLIHLLDNTLKSLLIYPCNNPIPKEFKRKLHRGLSEFLDSRDELKVKVTSSQLLYEEKVVYEDKEKEKGLAFILHKDGVRELAFLKGLEQEEVDDFVEAMEACLKSDELEEDLVTMLWEKDLNHIKYLVVDDLLDVDVPSAEDIPDNWDFNKLLRSEFALLREDASEFGLDGPDELYQYKEQPIKQLLDKLKEFSPEEIESIQKLLEMDNRRGSLDDFLNVLTEIFFAEKDLSEFKQMMETIERILDGLINVADFRSASVVVCRLKRLDEMMQKHPGRTEDLAKNKAEAIRTIVHAAGEGDKIKRISQVLNEREKIELSWVKEYLLSLNWNSIPHIVGMLGELKGFQARKMVCDVLTEKGKDHLELLEEGLIDPRWYVVRNVVSVLGRIGSEKGAKFLRRVIRHPDVRVRKEVVSSLFKISGSVAGRLLASSLEDQDKRIRILACRGLAQRKEKEAMPALMKILEEDQFKDKPAEEKKQMLESFASIGGDGAIPFLAKLVSKRCWLKRDKHNETRIFAIGALGLIDLPEAQQALIRLSKKRNKVIRQACQRALHRFDSSRIRREESTNT